MKFFLCEITGRNRRCVIRRIFFLRKNKKVTDNHAILDVSGIFCRKMVSLGKKRGGIKMRNLLNRYLSNLMSFGLERVATGAATKCCYFILHQPKVPENLKKYSETKK